MLVMAGRAVTAGGEPGQRLGSRTTLKKPVKTSDWFDMRLFLVCSLTETSHTIRTVTPWLSGCAATADANTSCFKADLFSRGKGAQMFVSLLHVTVTTLLNHTSAASASGWLVGCSHTSPQTQTASDHQGWILTGFEANLQFQNMSRRRKVPAVNGGGWSCGWSSAWLFMSHRVFYC